MANPSTARTYEFDQRHLIPMALEFMKLVTVGLCSKKRRSHAIGLGRNIRAQAFDAWDNLPSIPMGQLPAYLGADDSEIILPALSSMRVGGFGLAPYVVLATVVRALKPRKILEFGTYRGVGTLTMALNAPQSEIVTIDLPMNFETTDVTTLTKGDKEVARRARENVGIAFLGHLAAHNIRQVYANSLAFDVRDAVRAVDFCFIDGGHSYECIKADTENALNVLAPSGTIMWDDYAWFAPGVHTYLRELTKRLPLVRIAETQYVLLVKK
jgi:predicted O-methyltransferase YrrM